MNIELELNQLTERARQDKELRQRLLATKKDENPLSAFVKICEGLGYNNITLYGMLTLGEEFCAAMLRSVNGGGVEAPDLWDDYYGLFMAELENMK